MSAYPFDQPGHPVTGPDRTRRWLAEAGVVITEHMHAGVYEVSVPDLHEPVVIRTEDVHAAASGVANLIAARIHEARRDQERTSVDDPVDEQLAGMLARALMRRAE